jgi:NAD-dependent SIR2 family protein deacetylase
MASPRVPDAQTSKAAQRKRLERLHDSYQTALSHETLLSEQYDKELLAVKESLHNLQHDKPLDRVHKELQNLARNKAKLERRVSGFESKLNELETYNDQLVDIIGALRKQNEPHRASTKHVKQAIEKLAVEMSQRKQLCHKALDERERCIDQLRHIQEEGAADEQHFYETLELLKAESDGLDAAGEVGDPPLVIPVHRNEHAILLVVRERDGSVGSASAMRRRDASPPTGGGLQRCAELVATGKRVVVITGAGLSCASGIPPFRSKRSEADAVWNKQTERVGTRRAFLQDPVRWYNAFWLQSFAPKHMRKPPNAGHEALAALTSLPGTHVRIVTQNVDGLHRATATQWNADAHLVEVHGRVGRYKCSSATGSSEERCPYVSERCILPEQFSASARARLGHRSAEAEAEGEAEGTVGELTEAPACPSCAAPCMPQALLFDEDYADHAFYQVGLAHIPAH